jgi:hypothetical protein
LNADNGYGNSAGFLIDQNFSDRSSYFVLLLEERLPINLFRSMTITTPEMKKNTGAYKVVYWVISGIVGCFFMYSICRDCDSGQLF